MSEPATSPVDLEPVDVHPTEGEPIKTPAKVYGARQRFDLATILVLFVLFSLGFGVMAMLGVYPIVQLWLAGLLVWVAAAQAIFEQSCPRRVSRLAGLAYCGVVTPLVFYSGLVTPFFFNVLFGRTYAIPIATTIGWIFGVPLGYLGGALVAGVFLVADVLRGGKSASETNPTVGFDDLRD